jgi:iron complex outermembrane receptor protein
MTRMPRFCAALPFNLLMLLSIGIVARSALAAGGELREVTVTAEKQTLDLQLVPLAITAVSGSMLDHSNVTDLSGLNGYVPGLTITKSGGYENIVTIRGIGSETPQSEYTAQPGVSFNVDGVAIANSIALDQVLFDIDQIEVLRGPQATVFGQASTGGAVNVITKQPVLREFSGSGDASYGNYNFIRVRDEMNIPIGATLAIRASVQKLSHRGFATDTDIPGYQLDDANDYSGKVAMLWAPLDNVRVALTAQFYHANQNGAEQKNLLDTNPDPRVVSQDYPGAFRLDTQLFYVNLKWDLPWTTIKSVTSAQYLKHAQQVDGSRSDIETLGFYDDIAGWDTWVRNITQEFSMTSTPGGLVDWTAGAFYMAQRTHEYVVEFEGTGANPDLTLPPLNTTSPPPNLFFEHDAHVDHLAWAPYLQATYHLTDALRLTTGGRYNRDSYGGVVATLYNALAPAADVTYGKGNLTGKVEVQYDVAPTSMAYTSLTHSYKPGGLNNNSGAVAVANEFQPEEINAYEIGSKNRFLDNTLGVNIAAYYYNYKNMQFIAMDPIPYDYGISNIPETHLWGMEAEVSHLTLQSRLRLNADISLAAGVMTQDFSTLDSTSVNRIYATNPACADIFSTACVNAVAAANKNTRGNLPPKMPRAQGSLNAAYTATVGSYSLIPRAEYVYRGHYIYRVFNEGSQDMVAAYGIVNLSLALLPASEKWNAALFLSNALNKDGINSKYTDPFGTYQTSVQYVAPRQIIGSIGYRF